MRRPLCQRLAKSYAYPGSIPPPPAEGSNIVHSAGNVNSLKISPGCPGKITTTNLRRRLRVVGLVDLLIGNQMPTAQPSYSPCLGSCRRRRGGRSCGETITGLPILVSGTTRRYSTVRSKVVSKLCQIPKVRLSPGSNSGHLRACNGRPHFRGTTHPRSVR